MSWRGQSWGPEQPRFVADLTGDGTADIVGFGVAGVWTSLNNGNGTFQPAKFVVPNFGYSQGWRVDQHPRFVADVTGDGKADIIGFGNDGVWVALGNGDGTFQLPRFVLNSLGYNQGWLGDQHPRFVADVTGDGKADIIGFANDGVWVALSNGDGTFQPPKLALAGFSPDQGWRIAKHLDDDKNSDTTLNILSVNRLSATSSQDISVATDIAKGQTFPDSGDTDKRIDVPLASNSIFLRNMVFIDIGAGI
jgi:hypothetical protein